MAESKKYQLNSKDLMKIFHGLLIALGGATLTYVTEIIPMIELGDFSPLVVAAWSVIINLVRKFVTGK